MEYQQTNSWIVSSAIVLIGMGFFIMYFIPTLRSPNKLRKSGCRIAGNGFIFTGLSLGFLQINQAWWIGVIVFIITIIIGITTIALAEDTVE